MLWLPMCTGTAFGFISRPTNVTYRSPEVSAKKPYTAQCSFPRHLTGPVCGGHTGRADAAVADSGGGPAAAHRLAAGARGQRPGRGAGPAGGEYTPPVTLLLLVAEAVAVGTAPGADRTAAPHWSGRVLQAPRDAPLSVDSNQVLSKRGQNYSHTSVTRPQLLSWLTQ